MHYLDREIQRLVKYSEGLGLSVTFVTYRPGDPGATYSNIDKSIEIYKSPGTTKTSIILYFLHELGHHFDWVYNMKRGVDSSRLLKAMSLEWDRTKRTDPLVPKHLRRLIYEMECRGIEYMDDIALELDLRLPIWKVRAEQEYDAWSYRHYWLTGNTPLMSTGVKKRREIRDKWKVKS